MRKTLLSLFAAFAMIFTGVAVSVAPTEVQAQSFRGDRGPPGLRRGDDRRARGFRGYRGDRRGYRGARSYRGARGYRNDRRVRAYRGYRGNRYARGPRGRAYGYRR
jgi:hypothetical protein